MAEDEDAVVCCGLIEKLAEDYGWPFDRPLRLDVAKGEFVQSGWSLCLLKRTKGGGISTGKTWTLLKFCPFCGADLRPEEESEEVDP